MLTHGSLFSGIGGFDLAAQWAGIKTVWQVENDPFCNKVLEKHFPNAKRFGDIKTVRGGADLQPVDIISGGFPCQPFSCAGKRRGAEDDRFLWPEMLRIISEVRPTWAICENVPGIVNMELDQVLVDLEGAGYETQTFIIPACGLDAPHIRKRVWIVAHAECNRWRSRRTKRKGQQGRFSSIGTSNVSNSEYMRRRESARNINSSYEALCASERKKSPFRIGSSSENVAYSDEFNGRTRAGREAFNHCQWIPEPDVGRVAHGVSYRVDRLRALGNAIVPQVAFQFFKMIKLIERETINQRP
jgi:DNA (cytosine-5)-methyltransferase 1